MVKRKVVRWRLVLGLPLILLGLVVSLIGGGSMAIGGEADMLEVLVAGLGTLIWGATMLLRPRRWACGECGSWLESVAIDLAAGHQPEVQQAVAARNANAITALAQLHGPGGLQQACGLQAELCSGCGRAGRIAAVARTGFMVAATGNYTEYETTGEVHYSDIGEAEARAVRWLATARGAA